MACSSTRVSISPLKPAHRVCQAPGEKLRVLVLWRPEWRADQKEPEKREAAAKVGIEDFFRAGRCFSSVQIERSDAAGIAAYLQSAGKPVGKEDYIHITVRELGPVVRVFSSLALLEGGTEVVLEIEILHAAAGDTEKYRVHWQDGGPWKLKGVKTLAADMTAALTAVLD